MVDLALKNLVHDKLRFLMTVAGVAFADTLVLVQTGLFVGLLDNATITIEKMDADVWITSKNTPNVDFAHAFGENLVHRVRSVEGIARADNLIVTFMDVSLPTGARESCLVYALEDFKAWRIPWNVVQGDTDDLRRGRYVFLDESAEKRFGPFKVGDYREVLDTRLEVIGVTREALSFTTSPVIFMDYRLAQSLIPNYLEGNTTYVIAKLTAGADPEAVRGALAEKFPHHDVHLRESWMRSSRDYWIESTGLGINMYTTVFLGCLVGVVVVAQTLYTSTMEHLREFGTMKAIGGSNLDIYGVLARQATIAAIAGFALGAIPPLGVRELVESMGLKLLLPPAVLVATFLGTVLLCLAASAVSFRKVASLDPALVFRG